MGERKSFQHLRRLQTLSGNMMDDSILKVIFYRKATTNDATYLTSMEDYVSMCDTADKSMEVMIQEILVACARTPNVYITQM